MSTWGAPPPVTLPTFKYTEMVAIRYIRKVDSSSGVVDFGVKMIAIVISAANIVLARILSRYGLPCLCKAGKGIAGGDVKTGGAGVVNGFDYRVVIGCAYIIVH